MLLSSSDKQYLKLLSLDTGQKSSYTLALDLKKNTGVSVHPSTVRRQLNAMDLKGCVAVKKPSLRKGNRQKRRKLHWNIKTGCKDKFPEKKGSCNTCNVWTQ